VICPRCCTTFRPVTGWQRWCSPACRQAGWRRRAGERWAVERDRQLGEWSVEELIQAMNAIR
jgi:hypothetical protein